MQKRSLLTKAASIAVCFGILMSGPVSAFDGVRGSVIRDIELTADGTLQGQVYTSEGRAISNADVELQFQGTQVARTVTSDNGQFAITGVRGGAHTVVVGGNTTPVRLWKSGTAPAGAVTGVVVAADENIVRGQTYDQYGNPCETCPPSSGFGLIDVVTLAMVGTSVAALIIAIDNNNKLDDIQAALPASP